MSDAASGRRFLRPPSSVSRKSQSFNAADRNKIKDVPMDIEPARAIPNHGFSPATNSALAQNQTDWRSRSMNVKHSFTHQGNSTPSKLAKKSDVGAVKNINTKSKATNSPTHLVKVDSASKMLPPSSGKQKLVKPKQSAKREKETSSLASSSSASSKSYGAESSRMARPAAKSTSKTSKLKVPGSSSASKSKTGLVPPRTAVSRSASNSSRSSTATAASPDRKPTNLRPKNDKQASAVASKSSNSVLGRLRKKASAGTSIPNDSPGGVTLKQAVSVKSPTQSSKTFGRPLSSASNSSAERKGLTTPSKLAVPTYKTNPTPAKMQAASSAQNSNSAKQASGIKSTFQRAFGKDDKAPVPKSKLQGMAPKSSPSSTRSSSNPNRNNQYRIEDCEVIVTDNSDETTKRFSGEENVYRRDRIDVKNLKNLLVKPYENTRTKLEVPQKANNVVLDVNELDLSDSDEISKASMTTNDERSVGLKPDKSAPASPLVNHQPNYETGIRNVKLPTSTEGRKPQKTATVAPFRRQVPEPASNDEPSTKKSTEDDAKFKANDMVNNKANNAGNVQGQTATNPPVSMEERRKTARGIADLRQNLEETMVSLRNSQLKNRLSDEFERRISAQLDNEVVEELGLPEVPPPLSSNAGFRSKTSISGLHTISHTRSPKLHAGESLGPGSYTSPRNTTTSVYSSLQRSHVGRGTRKVWEELPEKKQLYKDETEDFSSVSSEDISELITGVSTDDISLSSITNSPMHIPKPNSKLKKSSLTKSKITTSIESLEKSEKSSNSTSESTRSLSSWKKTKSGSKSDSESKTSKKKAERKNSGKAKGKEKGSSAVGSRLAGADRSGSPTSSPAPQPFLTRNAYSYQSLPRTKRLQYTDNGLSRSNLTPPTLQNGREGFVRSPALKLLLRSKAIKAKSKPNLADTPENSVPTLTKSLDADPYSCDVTGSITTPNEMSEENGPAKTGYHSYGLTMSATQSLPRRFARKNGATTWSQPRSNANAAYSLPATPDNLYDQYGSYIDNSVPYSESASSFSNLDVPDFDNFTDAMSRSFHDKRKKPEWVLGGLQPSSASVAASSPNVSRAVFSDRNYRTISSSHEFKRRGSSLSLGAPSALSQNEINDEASIATASWFLHSLSHNKVAHQAHMVQEFEKSLSHLTSRLRELSSNAEEKDTELNELRSTIESLKQQQKQSINGDDWELKGRLKKKPSCGSLSSMSSATSISSAGSVDDGKSSKKKRGWLKSSFKSAFGRSKSKANLSNGDNVTSRSSSPLKNGKNLDQASLSSFNAEDDACDSETVHKLKEELRQKERKLTDIRLEALTSRHQLQHLQDTMNQMKTEIESLRKENEQLHQLGLSAYSLTSSSTFLHSKLTGTSDNIAKSSEEIKVKILVQISSQLTTNKAQYITINTCPILKTLNWSQLDQKLTKVFMAFCQTVDPSNCLKLNKTSVERYSIGEAVREIGSKTPELLPCGYLVGGTDSIILKLLDGKQNNADSLAFELLLDKTIAEKYVDLVLEQRRIVLCGPVGSGKTLLANRLASYVAEVHGSTEPIIYLDAKQKALTELQDFLQSIASAMKRNSDVMTIVVIDNLQNVKNPQIILEPFSQPTPLQGLYLICVTNRKSNSILKEFCWVTWNNNSPPVQTFLARKLRRSYLEHQISQNQKPDNVLSLVITWLSKCWQYINDFLESHGGSEVTIGPRMFSSCPMDASSARVWFTDLWNFSVVPYVISTVKRSSTRKNSAIHWTDPTEWVLETMPWRDSPPNLLHIRSEDIGHSPTENEFSSSTVMSQSSCVTSQSTTSTSQSNSDPLLNMLMRLQEAANYDSDASHDENFELSIDKALTELGS